MATEPIQSGPYPVPADPPDGPNQMSAIVVWAAGRLNMRFASTAARDAAIPAPTAGMECTIGSGAAQVKYIHDGSAWRPLWQRGMSPQSQSGVASIDVSGLAAGAATASSPTIPFPAAFASAPTVIATVSGTPYALFAITAAVTPTGFSLRVGNARTSAIPASTAASVAWIAQAAT